MTLPSWVRAPTGVCMLPIAFSHARSSATPSPSARRRLPLICTHTHQFNGPFSGTTRMSRYQKGKTDLDFTEARDGEWQWHRLGRMQVSTSLQTDNHASTPPLNLTQVFYRPDALPAAQPTASKHRSLHPLTPTHLHLLETNSSSKHYTHARLTRTDGRTAPAADKRRLLRVTL